MLETKVGHWWKAAGLLVDEVEDVEQAGGETFETLAKDLEHKEGGGDAGKGRKGSTWARKRSRRC